MAFAAISFTSSAPNTPTATGPPITETNNSRARSGVTMRGPPAKIAPTYAAPRRTASLASSTRARPQNLTLATRPSLDANEVRTGGGAVLRGRQRRSNEPRVGAQRGCTLDVGTTGHAALVHCNAIRGHEREEARADRVIDRERFE